MSDLESNPWVDLPNSAPFVLPGDESAIKAGGKRAGNLRLEAVPDPFICDPARACVFLLALNPGFRPNGNNSFMNDPLYQAQTRANVLHEAKPPFYYLTAGLEASDGYRWWHHIFNSLIKAGLPELVIAEHTMAVQFFPYRSETYADLGAWLPSQRYSHSLVRQAVKDGKHIIVMRSEKLWLSAVPELAGYPYVKVRNVRRPTLSPANLGQENFERLLDEYERATTRDRFVSRPGEFEIIDTSELNRRRKSR